MHKIRMHPPLLLFSKGLSKSKPWSSLFGSLAASFLWRPLGFARPPHDGVALLAALLKKMRLTNFIIRFWGISRQHISESQCLGAGLPLFTESPRETVWKVLGGRDGSLRCAPWRAGDTLQICPTMNGVASVRIFPSPQGGDAPGFTAYGRSSTPSSTCSRAAALGDCCRGTSRLGRLSTTGSGDGASTGRGSV